MSLQAAAAPPGKTAMEKKARFCSEPPACSSSSRVAIDIDGARRDSNGRLQPAAPGAVSALVREISAEVERRVQARLVEHHASLLQSILQSLQTTSAPASPSAPAALPPAHDGGWYSSADTQAQDSSNDQDTRPTIPPFLCVGPTPRTLSKMSSGRSRRKSQLSSGVSLTSIAVVERRKSFDVRSLAYDLSGEFLMNESMQQPAPRQGGFHSTPSSSRGSFSASTPGLPSPRRHSSGSEKVRTLVSRSPFPCRSSTESRVTPAPRSTGSPRRTAPPSPWSIQGIKSEKVDISMSDLRDHTISDLLGTNRATRQDQPYAVEEPVVEDEDGVVHDESPEGGTYVSSHPSLPAKPRVPVVLHIAGLVPWNAPCKMSLCAVAYQWAVLALATLAALALWQHVLTSHHAGACDGDGLFSDIAVAAGAVLGLLGLGVHLRSRAFVELLDTLEKYGQRWDMLEIWHKDMCKHLATSFFLWASIVAFRVHNEVDMSMACGIDSTYILRLVAFAFLTGLIMCMCFCMLSVCSALSTMIDVFCVGLLRESLEDAVLNWNIVQALLRRSSHSIQGCFFVLQGTALTILMLTTADVFVRDHYGFSHIPGILLSLVINRIVFSAAAVTGKCGHVPSLISSFCNTFDSERQYVTQHIIHSAAGFYVFEVLLTSSMAMKFTYFAIIGTFTLTTKVLSDS